jgi:hypothetical protein
MNNRVVATQDYFRKCMNFGVWSYGLVSEQFIVSTTYANHNR